MRVDVSVIIWVRASIHVWSCVLSIIYMLFGVGIRVLSLACWIMVGFLSIVSHVLQKTRRSGNSHVVRKRKSGSSHGGFASIVGQLISQLVSY